MENLRIIREKQHKSQVNVAVNIGVAQEMISNYESGKTYPTAKNLIKLAKYLDTSTDYLLGLTNDPTPVKYLEHSSLSQEEISILIQYEKLATEDKIKMKKILNALTSITN